jgi:hypothetical protein
MNKIKEYIVRRLGGMFLSDLPSHIKYDYHSWCIDELRIAHRKTLDKDLAKMFGDSFTTEL